MRLGCSSPTPSAFSGVVCGCPPWLGWVAAGVSGGGVGVGLVRWAAQNHLCQSFYGIRSEGTPLSMDVAPRRTKQVASDLGSRTQADRGGLVFLWEHIRHIVIALWCCQNEQRCAVLRCGRAVADP